MSKHKQILNKSTSIIQAEDSLKHKMERVCDLLWSHFDYYDWVGFYLSSNKEQMLHLGPYKGSPTEHLIIPFGKGVCGQAAQKKTTILVGDVSQEENYIACSTKVKSEIVVPIIKQGKMYGQIDVDSNKISAFTNQDKKLLEQICKEFANYF
tara:strand:- start:963 stop:1418 length:456 start_codon:yes stop_codon:yes gene_type:complete